MFESAAFAQCSDERYASPWFEGVRHVRTGWPVVRPLPYVHTFTTKAANLISLGLCETAWVPKERKRVNSGGDLSKFSWRVTNVKGGRLQVLLRKPEGELARRCELMFWDLKSIAQAAARTDKSFQTFLSKLVEATS